MMTTLQIKSYSRSRSMFLLFLLAIVSQALGFAPVVTSKSSIRCFPTSTELLANRRQILETTMLTASAIAFSTLPAYADVSDGNELPNGIAQFARLVKVKSSIAPVKKRLSENAADIDKEEWTNIGKFLRRIYSEGEDMKAIAPKGKASEAETLADQLREYSKAGDSSVNARDAPALVAILDKCSAIFQQFFDLSADVPDL